MNALDTALQAWHTGSGPLADRTNGLWAEPAPPVKSGGPELPFITYNLTGSLPDNSMSQTVDDEVVTFYIRSAEVSPLEVGELFDMFRLRWDNAALPMAGYTVVRCDRIGGGGRVKDADGGWVVLVTYNLHNQKGA